MSENLLDLPLAVRRAITQFTRRLKEKYGDVEIYLFGSYARGDWLEDSDIDLIVVSKKFRRRDMPRRVADIRCLAAKNMAFEILAYTPAEFKSVLKKSVTCQDALTYWRKLEVF